MTNELLEKKGICLKTKVGHLNIVSLRAGVQRRKRFRHLKHSKEVSLIQVIFGSLILEKCDISKPFHNIQIIYFFFLP